MIQPGEFCRVTNNKDDNLKIKHDRKIYNLHPHQEVVLPFEAAVSWFGDPYSIDKVQLIRNEYGKVMNMLPARPEEIRRLRFKYGASLTGDESTFDDMPNLPNITVKDLDGNEIVMVVSDPEGARALGQPASSGTAQNAELLSMLRQQEKRIQTLMKQLGMDEAEGISAAGNEDELPIDEISDSRPAKFKVYNTETGVPGPELKELV